MTRIDWLLLFMIHRHAWCMDAYRWSKIAEDLPGRTDNEIKNYWRTRVQKYARIFNCQVNSKKFRDLLQNIWIPCLLQRIVHQDTAISAAQAQRRRQLLLQLPNTTLSTQESTPSVVEDDVSRGTAGVLCGWYDELSEALPNLNSEHTWLCVLWIPLHTLKNSPYR